MSARNQLRIIGGQWRSQRLRFPPIAGLRPTPDAVRETLFNWLQPYIQGARCLDLFAGSGALGLEAVSRGARQAVLVDRSAAVIRSLRENVARLQARSVVQVVQAEAYSYLACRSEPFDLVFLDPPFGTAIIEHICGRLCSGGWISGGALVYLESDRHRPLGVLPGEWQSLRAGTAGTVAYQLLRYAASLEQVEGG